LKTRLVRTGLVLFVFATATSCTAAGGASQGAMGYKDAKSMVLDILKSEDGQKAILEATAKQAEQDPTLKLLSTGQGEQIRIAVKEILTGQDAEKLLHRTMTDPHFAGPFAKALQADLKTMHKELMKDPEYQQAFADLLKTPELETHLIALMRTPAFRQQVAAVVQDSMRSPLFQAAMLELVKQAIEEGAVPRPEMQASGKAKEQKDKKKKEEGGEGEGQQQEEES